MGNDPKGTRARAEATFDKTQRTTDDAKAHVDKERDAVRRKTERLRKLRLAKEAGEGVTEPRQEADRSKKAQGAALGVKGKAKGKA